MRRRLLVTTAFGLLIAAGCVALMSQQQKGRGPAAAADPTTGPTDRPTGPDPKLTSREVVEAQLAALAGNDPATDAGIAACFGFASPENQSQTGPADRFAQVVRAPAYAPLLNHKNRTFLEAVEDDIAAEHVVGVEDAAGNRHLYLFRLGKQRDGPFRGCWMTDGVTPVQPRDGPDQGLIQI